MPRLRSRQIRATAILGPLFRYHMTERISSEMLQVASQIPTMGNATQTVVGALTVGMNKAH